MIFLGWNLTQWALACAQMSFEGTTIDEAIDYQFDYLNKYGRDPVDRLTIIVDKDTRPKDYATASKIFTLARAAI